VRHYSPTISLSCELSFDAKSSFMGAHLCRLQIVAAADQFFIVRVCLLIATSEKWAFQTALK